MRNRAIGLFAKAALLGFISVVPLQPSYSQSPAGNASEAEKLAGQLWDRLLTKCGDSYYLYFPAKIGLSDRLEQWQYKGVRFHVVSRHISSNQQVNGVQWEGVAVMSASVFRSRSAKPQSGAAGDTDPKAWNAWREWSDGFVPSDAFLRDMPPGFGDPPNVIGLKKEKGKWLVEARGSRVSSYAIVPDLDEIERRKPSCAGVSDKPAGK